MAKQPQDDLFEGGTMSFGEHLEELRICLFRSLFGVIIGCLIGLYAAEYVVVFFQGPLERALKSHYLARAIEQVKDDFDGNPPVEFQETIIKDELIPEKVSVEPAQIASVMGLSFPDYLKDSRISSSTFVPADFKEAGSELAVAKLLAEQKASKTDSPARRLWQMMSAEQQAAITKLAEVRTSFTPAERQQLIMVLNELLAQKELHDSAEFAALAGASHEATSALREAVKKEENPETTRRLNKFLVAGALADHVRSPRVNLVTFYNWKPVKVRFQVLNAQEAFMIYLKAALLTGVVISSPWIFFQIWNFVATGLYPHEKNQVFLYLPISMLLFFAGASLAFGFVFEPVLNFLFQFNQGLNAEFDPRIGEWLSFVLILPLGFGISFQLPLVMLFVNRLGLVSVDVYMKQWRMAILIIFVVAMVLTPADPISMMLMAVPLCGLYVLGIGMCIWMPQSRSPFTTAYEPSA
ncbi:Sec-independent protein translocase protein TatCy [Anatilimnocola aggregata]|uniref:Sec-independent protein translocase protein TatC n=2 Tax=Anatilimnocola aggregata TaxID=2528021 RepID=A0A517YC66_9BACT|nr:Sec-independent protein translocase protein TatCy [Anatilimnocola aggregata]